jgi:signal transduction histidine kinase
VIESAVEQVKSQAEAKKILIQRKVPDAFAEVDVDQHRIVQVLVNLLSNAIDFSGNGTSIVLTAKLLEDCLCLTVEDSGRGISKEDQQNLFARPSAFEPAGTDRRLALGLPICKMLVEAHGGRISVLSTPEQGSIFTVELPLIRQTEA